nr:MAG TPA: hypothetical protein [Caudoviricetes sp.]
MRTLLERKKAALTLLLPMISRRESRRLRRGRSFQH